MKIIISLVLILVLTVSGCNAPTPASNDQSGGVETLTESMQELQGKIDDLSSRIDDLDEELDGLRTKLERLENGYEEQLGLTNKDLSIQNDRIDDMSRELSIELDSIKYDINDLKRSIRTP